jgi:hypothetical protein
MEQKKLQAKIVNLHGTTMMSVDKVTLKGDDITMVGNIMGTMPGTFYITPENLWKMFKMINASLIFAMPGMLLKGRRAYKKSQTESKAA